MKTILVLFGGCSTEYEVSLQSACAILGHMDARQYAPLPVGITREGQWRYFPGPLFHLETGDWQDQPACVPCTLSLDRGARQLLLSDGYVFCNGTAVHGYGGNPVRRKGFHC